MGKVEKLIYTRAVFPVDLPEKLISAMNAWDPKTRKNRRCQSYEIGSEDECFNHADLGYAYSNDQRFNSKDVAYYCGSCCEDPPPAADHEFVLEFTLWGNFPPNLYLGGTGQ